MMTGKRKKRQTAGNRPKRTAVYTILTFGFIFTGLFPGWGMEALTQAELSQLAGQQGITIGFGSDVSVEATFHSLCQGDPDGWGNSQNDSAGWLVLMGSGTNTAALKVTIPGGSIMEIDVGRSGAGTCSPVSKEFNVAYQGIAIPPQTPFFTFSLTDTDIGLSLPDSYIYIRLSDQASSGELVGKMICENLMIDKDEMTSSCYIWAHEEAPIP